MTPQPLTDLSVVDDLGADLRAAGFDSVGIPGLLGAGANGALARGEYWAARLATAGDDPLPTLVRLFLLGGSAEEGALERALPRTGIARAAAHGVLEQTGGRWQAALDIRPHADDGGGSGRDNEYLVISDLDSDTRPGPVAHDHVLGIGQASLSLAGAVIREPVGSALDLGTGCGIQALHLNGHADRIVATDTNPRALALAAATARINGQEWDLRMGSLYEPVAGEQFDLIVSNPPFVIGGGEQQYIYRDSGMAGDGICQALVTGAAAHLKPGGTAQFLANWMVIGDQDWRTRVGEWVAASGCDAWVVQRELADPTQYVSLWLADAGESPERTAECGRAWLDWFAENEVTAIGMGVITVRRKATDDDSPVDQVLDEITGAGEEVTGVEADGFLRRRAELAALSDDDLLSLPWELHPAVLLTERSLPGHDGWMPMMRMVIRSGGPGATLQVDEWGRALLAGCRGQLPLGTLVDLLATAHELDPAALTEAVLPSVRVAIARGVLIRSQR